jgi:hypothetical protein
VVRVRGRRDCNGQRANPTGGGDRSRESYRSGYHHKIADGPATTARLTGRISVWAARLALRRVSRFNGRMSDSQVDFSAPATLRKWPSVNNERVSASLNARTYMIIEGTLDECIRKFLLQPKSQRHLYEIHTVPQTDPVGAILSTDDIVELARLRDFQGK